MAGIGRTPNSTITFYNVPQLDTKAGKTLAFRSVNSQKAYFNNHIVKTVSNCVVIKKRFQTVDVPNKINEIEYCNYLSFVNPDIDDRTYYCAIQSVDYINEETTRVSYLIDWWLTDMHRVTFEPTFLQREGLSKEEYDGLSANPYDMRYAEKMRSQEPLACNIETEHPGYVIQDDSGVDAYPGPEGMYIPAGTDGCNLFSINNTIYANKKVLSCLMFTVPDTYVLDTAALPSVEDHGAEYKNFVGVGKDGMFERCTQATKRFVDTLNKIRLSERYILYNNLQWASGVTRPIYLWYPDEDWPEYTIVSYGNLDPTNYYKVRDDFYAGVYHNYSDPTKPFPSNYFPPDTTPYGYPTSPASGEFTIVEGRNDNSTTTMANIYTNMETVSREFLDKMTSGYSRPYMLVIAYDEYIKPLVNLLSEWGMTSNILGYYSIPETIFEEFGADLYLGGQGTSSYQNSNFKKFEDILVPLTNYTGDVSPKLWQSPYSFLTLHSPDGSTNVDYDPARLSIVTDDDYKFARFKLVVEINPSGVFIGAGPKTYQNVIMTHDPNDEWRPAETYNFENFAFFNQFPQVPYITDAFVDFMATKARDVISGNTQQYKLANNQQILQSTLGMWGAGTSALSGAYQSGVAGMNDASNFNQGINEALPYSKSNQGQQIYGDNLGNFIDRAASKGAYALSNAAGAATQALSMFGSISSSRYNKQLAEYRKSEIGGAGEFFAGKTDSDFYRNYAGVAAAYAAPNYHPGSCGGVLNMLRTFRSIGIYFLAHRRSSAYLTAFNRFFKLFGYNTTQYKKPSIATFVEGYDSDDNSPHFEAVNGENVFYTQTERCKITGTTGESAQFIELMMNGGMLFVDPTSGPTPPEPTTPEPTTPEPTTPEPTTPEPTTPEPTTPEPTTPEPTTPEPTTPEPTTPEPTTPEPTPTPTAVQFTTVSVGAGTGGRASAGIRVSVSGVDYSTDKYYVDNYFAGAGGNPGYWMNGSYAMSFYSFQNYECRGSVYCAPSDTLILKTRFRIVKDGETYTSDEYVIDRTITWDTPVVSTPAGAPSNIKTVTVSNISGGTTIQFTGKTVGGSSYNQVYAPITISGGSAVSANIDTNNIESVFFVISNGNNFNGSGEISLA